MAQYLLWQSTRRSWNDCVIESSVVVCYMPLQSLFPCFCLRAYFGKWIVVSTCWLMLACRRLSYQKESECKSFSRMVVVYI